MLRDGRYWKDGNTGNYDYDDDDDDDDFDENTCRLKYLVLLLDDEDLKGR